MNNVIDELKRKQLARLKGELIDPPIAESALEFVADPELDAAYARYCESQKYWDREPLPRIEWEARHREFVLRISVQPENPREQLPFIVGNRRDEYGDLEALPWPRWPSPGQPMTPEISRAHSNELLLVM